MSIDIYREPEPEKRPTLEELAARTAAEAAAGDGAVASACPRCGCKDVRHGRCRHCGQERKP